MKLSFTIVAVLSTAVAVMAQTNPTPSQTGGQSGQSQGQGAAKPPSPAGRKLPEAKTQEEYNAYKDAATKTDPNEMAAAADAFAAKFPNSELREILYVGDDPWLDVAAARAAGCRSAWMNRWGADWPGELAHADLEVCDCGELAARLGS